MKKQNWRPLRILFVGDEPSSRNVDPSVPFVGTPSYKRLLRWIGELDLCLDKVTIVNASEESMLTTDFDKVVFLGSKSTRLKLLQRQAEVLCNTIGGAVRVYSITSTIPTFMAPHPSPRNRKFNDPAYEAKMLRELKKWLYS